MPILSVWKTNKALTTLLIGNSLILIGSGMLGPVYAIFVKDIGGNLFNAGMTAGLLAITSGITAFITGRYLDHIKRTSSVLITGYFLMGIVFMLYIFVNNLTELYVIQIINGAVSAISAPTFDKLYAMHLNKASSGVEYGEWNATWFVTTGVGAIVGGIIADLYGFRSVFILMSLLAFSAAIFVKLKHKQLF